MKSRRQFLIISRIIRIRIAALMRINHNTETLNQRQRQNCSVTHFSTFQNTASSLFHKPFTHNCDRPAGSKIMVFHLNVNDSLRSRNVWDMLKWLKQAASRPPGVSPSSKGLNSRCICIEITPWLDQQGLPFLSPWGTI